MDWMKEALIKKLEALKDEVVISERFTGHLEIDYLQALDEAIELVKKTKKKRVLYAQECSCYENYPNMNYKKKNGKHKCIDCYVNIDNHDGYKRKTHCIRKDCIYGFNKEPERKL